MRHGCGWRAGLLLAFAVAMAIALALLPPFPQPQDYHRFADTRALLGVQNFLDVISNLAFVAVAVAGLDAVLRPGRAAFIDRTEHLPYALFFLALAATAFGSAWYHLAPDNARLFWDRLPISVCFAALLSAVIAERCSIRAGLLLLLPLAAVGAGTVWYWLWSEALGSGNVLPYFAFQVYALLAIFLLMLLFPPRYSRGADLYRAAMLYGAALAAELFDRHIYALGQVGGHTLKHLLAALAMYQIVHMLRLRTRI